MAKRSRFPDKPQWDQPEYSCPLCPEVEPFKPHEGRRRDRRLCETHRRLIVWNCLYSPMRKTSTQFDDLRTHVRAMHWRGQPLHPPTWTLEHLDWREERESRRRTHDDDPDTTRTKRGDRRARSPRSPPKKTAKRTSPADSSLGSIGASPGVLLSPLPTTPRPRRSPWTSVLPKETVGSSWEEPAPATGRAPPDPSQDLLGRILPCQTPRILRTSHRVL